MHASKRQPQPWGAASIAAMSIFFICIIASNARLAAAGSGSAMAFVRAIGVICQDTPHLSLHQPHALSWPHAGPSKRRDPTPRPFMFVHSRGRMFEKKGRAGV